ncbi:MAG: Curli biogenesis system outer membrane secretion channel CsgG [Thermodesulfobacterium sp.]|uniref:Curli biogenesis system outer membrane secretion channel CsgG n=1 Tax=Candidatus Thermodesulfobacterium syntrophicum TaxID=3060442 RepID=A0AAE3P662_9BACT|nr:Curli biogenesis system outer membrane secretion channel CsgG [Candidatus Thermodesulfobacterium syntrophicum]
MKILKILFFLILLSFLPLGLFAEEYAKEVKERTLTLPHCDRPIGIIAAKSFKCKAAACQGGRISFGKDFVIETTPQALGDGLADMLVTALANTGCFKVVERAALEEIKEELELMGVTPKQTLKAADFIITGAVTALEMNASGAGGGGFVIPLPWKFGGGLKLGKSKAHIALDMRIVRVKDAEILVAKTVEGKSERWKFGVAGGGLFGSTVGGGWFEAFKNTPLEEATRDLIARAVTLIVEELKAQSPEVTVGEKRITYGEKGQIVKEETSSLTANNSPNNSKNENLQLSETGGLKRPSAEFSHYKNILWTESFRNCKYMPTTVKILRGQGECVEFKGNKWFATTKGEIVFEKEIPKFDPSKDWALEYKIYFGKGGDAYYKYVHVFIGKEGSPINVFVRGLYNGIRFSNQDVPNEAGLPDNLEEQLIKIGLKKEGEIVHLFINGVRTLSLPVDSVAIGALPKKILIKLYGEDIGKGSYTLITDLKLSQD